MTLNQHFNEVATGYGDLWGGQNVDGYGLGTDANDIMIAGGDKEQLQKHSAVYGDYTVTVDTHAANFDFSFHSTGSGDTQYALTSGYFSSDSWHTDIDAGDAAAAGDAFPGSTFYGQYTTSAEAAINAHYLNFLNSLTGLTDTSAAAAEAHAVAAGYTPSDYTSFEMKANIDDTDLSNGAHPTAVADQFYALWETWTKAGAFTADHATNNIALDFNTSIDKVFLTTDGASVIDQSTFDSNFHVASVAESGAWNNGPVAEGQGPATTDSTMIYMSPDGGANDATWSVTLLGVHFGDLAGVTASAGDSLANKDAVYADLVGHAAIA